jgi:hypothetical protein
MISRKYMLVAVVIVSGVVLFSAPARATVYYVSKTGNDSNPCTQAQPCVTIQRGINVAAGGGNILYVGAGSFTEDPSVTTGGSSSSSMFTIQGFAPGGSCPTTASGDPLTPLGTHPVPTAVIVGHVRINASYVSFRCFELKPNNSEPDATGFNTGPNGIEATAAGLTYLNIEDNYIHKNGPLTSFGGGNVFNQAISMGTVGSSGHPVAHLTVRHNYLVRAAAQQTGGACAGNCLWVDEVGGYGNTYSHNYMHGMNNGDDCAIDSPHPASCHIDCFETSSWSNHDNVFDSNICFNQNEGFLFWECQTSGCRSYGNWDLIWNITITNNILAFGVGTGGQAPFNICGSFYHVGNIVWQNNTCWGNFFGIFIGSQVTSFQNNIMYGISGYCDNPYLSPDGTGQFITHDHNILKSTCTITSSFYSGDQTNVDPLWVAQGPYDNSDQYAHDLHLTSSSTAIAAGATGLGVTSDLDGVTRPSQPSIGPYEFVAGTSSSIQPPQNLRATAF